MQVAPVLKDEADIVLVFAADMPLLTAETLQRLTAVHEGHLGPVTMLTVLADDPRGFGRVVRGERGEVMGVVEEAEATAAQLAIRELNAGVYCFDADWLWSALPRLQPSAVKGEYYLTDAIGLAREDGFVVETVTTTDVTEVLGINTRVHLADAETALRRRINHQWMLDGVTMINPEATYVQPGVIIGPDTILWPGVCLRGSTVIGARCEIGPGAVLTDVRLGDSCRVGAGRVLSGVVAGPGSVFETGG